LERSRELAKEYGVKAIQALHGLKDSSAKEALQEMVSTVLERTK